METKKNNTVAAAGKESKKDTLNKKDIKDMSKFEAQQILNKRDPELLNRIEAEVAAKAAVIKKKVMFIGFLIILATIGYIVYVEMNKAN